MDEILRFASTNIGRWRHGNSMHHVLVYMRSILSREGELIDG